MDDVAQGLEATQGAADDGSTVALVEVGFAEVLVQGTARQQVVGGHQNAVANGDNRPACVRRRALMRRNNAGK